MNFYEFLDDKIKALKKLCEKDFYLVGGSIRDILLDKYTYDYDFIVYQDAIELCKKLAHLTFGAFVLLDTEHNIGRVVWNKKRNGIDLIFDISQIMESDLKKDLLSRDLTINALCSKLDENTIKKLVTNIKLDKEDIIDFSNGYDDLKNGIIRTYQEKNLIDDPLRMLRVFRFSTKFDFSIDDTTLDYVKNNNDKISTISKERVLKELYDIFNTYSSEILKKMFYSDILKSLFSELSTYEEDYDVFCEKVSFFETLIKNIETDFSNHIEINNYFFENIILERKRFSLAKFIILFFYLRNNSKENNYLAELEKFLKKFTFGAEEIKSILKNLQYFDEKNIMNQELTRANMYEYFTQLKNDVVINLFIFYILNKDTDLEKLKKVLTYFYEDKILSIQPKIIDGFQIAEKFNISGKELGKILEKIKKAQAEKIITSYEDSIDFIEQNK